MSIQKDPSGRRFIAVETEVPGTPEEVWQAIATGPGITSWFVPSRIEERVKGSVVLDFGPGMESKAEIQVWDPPRRLVAENKEGMGPGSPTVADEWTIEARAGGVCRVRVVHSWFADSGEWDKQYEDVESGWPQFFRILKSYLVHFRGQPCMQVPLVAMAAASKEAAWDELTRSLGLATANVGGSVKSSGDAPRLTAIVEHSGSKPYPEFLLRLEQPAPGLAHLFAMPMGGQTYVSVRLFFYGNEARTTAAREEAVWQAWLGRIFPAPVGQPGA